MQTRVGSTHVLVLAIDLLEPCALIRRDARARSGIDVRLSNPGPESFRRNIDELGDGGERGPPGRAILMFLEHYSHCSLTPLG